MTRNATALDESTAAVPEASAEPAVTFREGQQVIRGPDWRWGGQDGYEGGHAPALGEPQIIRCFTCVKCVTRPRQGEGEWHHHVVHRAQRVIMLSRSARATACAPRLAAKRRAQPGQESARRASCALASCMSVKTASAAQTALAACSAARSRSLRTPERAARTAGRGQLFLA